MLRRLQRPVERGLDWLVTAGGIVMLAIMAAIVLFWLATVIF